MYDDAVIRLSLVVMVALAASTVGCSDSRPSESATTAARNAIPFLAPLPELSIERDAPPAVRDRIVRLQQEFLERARDASRLRRTVDAGCRPTGTPGASLGPPPPAIAPRILGHHVEIVFSYASMPRSAACRPALLDVVVYSGEKATASFNNAGGVGHYLLRGARGRVILDVPWFGQPPYHVSVNSSTAVGIRGPSVERSLPCPVTGDPIKGCLAGYRPAAHAWPMPEPVLPVRGLNRATLEASLRYVLAGERWAPLARGVRCSTLRRCEVTFIDPSFPRSPYRVGYRIAGEQISGCWMALRGRIIDEPPYPDASGGRLQLAGCASWLR
jgi:hypothetical protein